ncbi:glutathione S-transferase family protein [Enhygromyxa salina]|nr:glutathione S-transferase family protein [Enhygromyxa salina]
MSKPKLTYFDFAGSRGEEARLALHLAGVDFEDNRLAGSWPELKPTTPFGSLPVLEIEGHPPLAQINAILVLIGRQHGLHPRDNWQAAHHEALMCAVEELRGTVSAVLKITNPEAKLAARTELAQGYLKQWGGYVERQLGDGPFVGGAEIGVADLKLYMAVKWFTSGAVDHVPNTVFADYPKLNALARAVAEHPKVVQWYAK